MIKVLIVDDSALMRRLFLRAFADEGDFDVAVARDGAEALSQLSAFKPDVVTLDVHMPGMDGLEVLDQVMLHRPCPVVMVSALTAEGAEITLRALELGAVDFIGKPGGPVSLQMDDFGPALVAKVRQAARARIPSHHRLAERLRANTATGPQPLRPRPRAKTPRSTAPFQPSREPGLVIVGCSTGGPQALDVLLSGLPADFPWPVIVVQHMPASFTGHLANRLDGLCPLTVVEASKPMPLEPGRVYVARGDADALISKRAAALTVLPAPRDPTYRWHPSVDRLVDSALALAPPERTYGVLMTGMGDDGAAAMTRLRNAGGWTIAEAEDTAVIWGMPGELVRAGGASRVEPLEKLAARLVDAVRETA